MPRIADLLKHPVNEDGTEKQWSKEEPLSSLMNRNINLPADQLQPSVNSSLRCPMPATGTVSPDSLRQYYKSGTPQFRVFTSK